MRFEVGAYFSVVPGLTAIGFVNLLDVGVLLSVDLVKHFVDAYQLSVG